VKFIETNDTGIARQILGDGDQGVLALSQEVQLLVHQLHEAVEVNAHLVGKRQRRVQRVDDVGLAAPDSAPQIKTPHRRCLRRTQQPAQAAHVSRAPDRLQR